MEAIETHAATLIDILCKVEESDIEIIKMIKTAKRVELFAVKPEVYDVAVNLLANAKHKNEVIAIGAMESFDTFSDVSEAAFENADAYIQMPG